MKLTLGGLTALLHEQLSCFKNVFAGRGWEEIVHEKISMTSISLPLIQEECAGELLAKECALTILVNCPGGLPGNSVDRLTDRARNDLKSVEEP